MAHIEALVISNPNDKNWTIVDVALSARTLFKGSEKACEYKMDDYRRLVPQMGGTITVRIQYGGLPCSKRWYTYFRAINCEKQEIEVRMYHDTENDSTR